MTESYSQKKQITEAATMQVKIFSGNNIQDAEMQVNEWLAINNWNVHYIGQSQCERNGSLLFVISVFYYSPSNN